MRTTLNIDEELVKRARELTQIKSKTDLIHAGLEALIRKAARERLVALGGTDSKAKGPMRRRST